MEEFHLHALRASPADTLKRALKLTKDEVARVTLEVTLLATTLDDGDDGYSLLFWGKDQLPQKTNITLAEDYKTWEDIVPVVFAQTPETKCKIAKQSPVCSNVYVRLDAEKKIAAGRVIPVVIVVAVEPARREGKRQPEETLKKWPDNITVRPILHLVELNEIASASDTRITIGKKGVQITKLAPNMKVVPVSIWLEYFTRMVTLSLAHVCPMYTVPEDERKHMTDPSVWFAYHYITRTLNGLDEIHRKKMTEVRNKLSADLQAFVGEIGSPDYQSRLFTAVRLSKECLPEDIIPLAQNGARQLRQLSEKIRDVPSAFYDRISSQGADYRHYVLKRANLSDITSRSQIQTELALLPLSRTTVTKKASLAKLLKSNAVDISDEIDHQLFKRGTKRLANLACSTALSFQLACNPKQVGLVVLVRPVRQFAFRRIPGVLKSVWTMPGKEEDEKRTERKQNSTSCTFPRGFETALTQEIPEHCALQIVRAYACQFPEPYWWSDTRLAQFREAFQTRTFTPQRCIDWLSAQSKFPVDQFRLVQDEKSDGDDDDTKPKNVDDGRFVVAYAEDTQTFAPVLNEHQTKLNELWRKNTYLLPLLAWEEEMQPAGRSIFNSGQSLLFRDMFMVTSLQIDVDPMADLFGNFNIGILQSPRPTDPIYFSHEKKQPADLEWAPKFFGSTQVEQETFVCYRKLQYLQDPERKARTECAHSAYLTKHPEFMRSHREHVFIKVLNDRTNVPDAYISILVFHDQAMMQAFFNVPSSQLTPRHAHQQTRYIRQMSTEYKIFDPLRRAFRKEGTESDAFASLVKLQLRMLLAKYCKHSAVVLMGAREADNTPETTAAVASYAMAGLTALQAAGFSGERSLLYAGGSLLATGTMASLAANLIHRSPGYQSSYWRNWWDMLQTPAATHTLNLATSAAMVYLSGGSAAVPIAANLVISGLIALLKHKGDKGKILTSMSHAAFIGLLGGLQKNFFTDTTITDVWSAPPAMVLGWLGEIASYVGAGESLPWLGPLVALGTLVASIKTGQQPASAAIDPLRFSKYFFATWTNLFPKLDAPSIAPLLADLARVAPPTLFVVLSMYGAMNTAAHTDAYLPIGGDEEETGIIHRWFKLAGPIMGVALVIAGFRMLPTDMIAPIYEQLKYVGMGD